MDKKNKIPNDDFFKIVYIILDELYACLKKDVEVNLDAISPERFGIEEGYMMEILWNLDNKGFITGAKIFTSEAGSRIVRNLNHIKITIDGIEYLQENTKMKKIYNALKEVRDWVPGF